MKYQGFYDYALDASGAPDRQYTALQFCKHLSMIFGSGIVITNATGNDPWKVEKVENENLKVKVKLGNNNFNFASLNGNPFAIDEELILELSQGTDRWDAIMIRADSTSTVRATDLKVAEGTIEIIRENDVFDLRLARVHIENNVITEIIDDRLNSEYCGIAAGLATINADDILVAIKTELEKIESGELVALKNGILQVGLNSEKIGGKKISEINGYIDCIRKYNTPNVSWNENYNTFVLDNEISNYEKNMRVLINTNIESTKFNTGIIPNIDENGLKNGYETDKYSIFDGNDNTKYEFGNSSVTIKFPIFINPTKIYFLNEFYQTGGSSASVTFYGILADDTEEEILYIPTTNQTSATGTYTLNIQNFYKGLRIKVFNSAIRTIQIVEGNKIDLNGKSDINYININSNGAKLINFGNMKPNTKYELVYDGTTFDAREVTF